MKKWLLACSVLIVLTLGLKARTSAKQEVVLKVEAINQMIVHGEVAPLTVLVPTSSTPERSTLDSSTRYSCTTNKQDQKIVGQLDEALPDDCQVYVKMDHPTSITSRFYLLGAKPIDVVWPLTRCTVQNELITYRFNVKLGAPAGSINRVVTYTLTNM